MNKQRRKELSALEARLAEVSDMIENTKTDLEGLRDEEREYYDNMPENMQNSEKALASEYSADAMDEALNCMENAIDAISDAVVQIQTSQE